MAVAKRRPAPTPADRAREARVAAGRPPSTQAPYWVVNALAELGGDLPALLEDWAERAAGREFGGEESRADAERGALGDVIEARTVQRRLL